MEQECTESTNSGTLIDKSVKHKLVSMEFFLNVFSEFAEFSDKKIFITAKGFEPQPPLV